MCAECAVFTLQTLSCSVFLPYTKVVIYPNHSFTAITTGNVVEHMQYGQGCGRKFASSMYNLLIFVVDAADLWLTKSVFV